jgi:hypothetical protein
VTTMAAFREFLPGPLADPCADKHIEGAVCRAFLVAYLITTDGHQAEAAAASAIDSWDPEAKSPQKLLRFSAEAATRILRGGRTPQRRRNFDSPRLPLELREVVCLSPQLRLSFVLKILLALPSPVCARMLGISADEVDETVCAALRRTTVGSGVRDFHSNGENA